MPKKCYSVSAIILRILRPKFLAAVSMKIMTFFCAMSEQNECFRRNELSFSSQKTGRSPILNILKLWILPLQKVIKYEHNIHLNIEPCQHIG
jgi:hypothetical protein